MLDENKGLSLLQGYKYPKSVIIEEKLPYYLDEFVFLNFSEREQNEARYGKKFLDAQECIIEEIKD